MLKLKPEKLEFDNSKHKFDVSLWEIIVNSYWQHGLKFDCSQEDILVRGTKPLIDFN